MLRVRAERLPVFLFALLHLPPSPPGPGACAAALGYEALSFLPSLRTAARSLPPKQLRFSAAGLDSCCSG